MSVSHGTWTVTRTYPHPRQAVFAAWADPAVKAAWFDLSGDTPSEYQGDFRVGGVETLRVTDSEGRRLTYDGQYRDIVDDQRIVTTYEMGVDGRITSVSVATVELSPVDAGTQLTYTEQGAFLDELDDAAARRSGLDTQLERLAGVLDQPH